MSMEHTFSLENNIEISSRYSEDLVAFHCTFSRAIVQNA